MKELMIEVFGEYVPTSYQSIVVTDSANGNYETLDVIPNGIAGLDIPWIAGFCLFAICVYCVFRLVGRSK